MPCFHPLHGFKSRLTTMSGKRRVVFNATDGFADLPVTIPCGACIGCRLERARQWSVRLMHEAKLHQLKCFVTLTYDDEHLPYGHTLVKRDFQLFMKRLRKEHAANNENGKIRFFHCGEYGETSQRPHYHAILYGIDFSDKKAYKRNAQEQQLFTSAALNRIWGHGFCTIGAVTPETCGYTARYILKKVTGKKASDHYRYVVPETGEVIQKEPEYVTMSRRPGIASDWYDEFKTDVFPSDTVITKGKEGLPPKFYVRRLEKEDPNAHKKLILKRTLRAAKFRADSTPERLKDRETVKLSKVKQLSRSL